MIITTLKEYSHYKSLVLKEIESAFHYNKEQSFAVDFYHLIKEGNLENCHLLLDEDKNLVAHIGVRPVNLQYKDTEVRVIFIGGIVTRKQYQGKGYFKKLYTEVIQRYSNDYALAILWTDIQKLYQKLGYRPFGLTAVLGEKVVTKEDIIKRGYREETNLELASLASLYDDSYKNTIKVKRSLSDWKDMQEITSTKIFIKGTRDNITDYIFFEKGQDLKGIIHECSFINSTKKVLDFNGYQLLSPFKVAEDNFFIHLAFGKILNDKLFCDFINKVTGKGLNLKFEKNYKLLIDDKIYQIERDELLPILFGPNQAQEVDGLVPPIYISGADSI